MSAPPDPSTVLQPTYETRDGRQVPLPDPEFGSLDARAFAGQHYSIRTRTNDVQLRLRMEFHRRFPTTRFEVMRDARVGVGTTLEEVRGILGSPSRSHTYTTADGSVFSATWHGVRQHPVSYSLDFNSAGECISVFTSR